MTPPAHEALSRTCLLVATDILPTLTDAQIADGLLDVVVAICADADQLQTAGAQTAVVATAIACAQSGAQVRLVFDDVPLVGRQPPLDGPLLRTVLDAHLRTLPTHTGGADGAIDLRIVIGDTALQAADPPPTLYAGGDDYRAIVGSDPAAPAGFSGQLPFGPMLAAVVLAGEAFKIALVKLIARHGCTPLAEHRLDPTQGVDLRLEPIQAGPLAGKVDIVSAGAITNNLLFALHRVPQLTLDARAFDQDIVAISNLNRYPTFQIADVGRDKTEALADSGTDTILIEPVRERLTIAVIDAQLPLADYVLVGADSIPARWLAQQHTNGWLSVAGTSHLMVLISDHAPDGPCAGCLHPRDEPGDGEIPTVAFVSMLAGLLQAHRLLARLAGHRPQPPTLAWPLALDAPYGMLQTGLSARADCPVGCPASAAASDS